MTIRRIAFVDDHPTLLRGIAALFSDYPDYQICGTGTCASDALALVSSQNLDVLILDLSMPGDVFAAIHDVAAASPKTKIVIFTAYANVDLALRSFESGAHAYVLKGRPFEEVLSAIEAAKLGDIFVSPNFAPKLISGFRNQRRTDSAAEPLHLSARENQIVECLFSAMSNKEIARQLHLTEKTVKHYMTNLMNKLQVKSRLEVIIASQELRRRAQGLYDSDIKQDD